jgi:hypothetical protein
MNVWAVVSIAFGAFFVMSVLIGIALARILAHIAAEASALLEDESWLSAPLSRAARSVADEELEPRRAGAVRRT